MKRQGFDPLPVLTGPSLILRPLTREDVPALVAAAADPAIWAQHPAQDRWKPEVMVPYAEWLADEGSLVVEDAAGVAGTSRFYEAWNAPGDISIGYTFLTRAHWGGAGNAELKALMLEHAFRYTDHVWFHIAADNLRSQSATAKLGARLIEETMGPGPEPKLYHCFSVSRGAWRASPAAATARAAGLALDQAES
ncbi:MAG: GNAT family N-acetyltransferase [Rhodobacterales bacterium]|nr:MAG: GNAT family N-acetyltransferase [Rhodobacterales bacterium]